MDRADPGRTGVPQDRGDQQHAPDMGQRRRQTQKRRLIYSNAGTKGDRRYQRLAVTWLNRVRCPEQERDHDEHSHEAFDVVVQKGGRAGRP